jgi:hypothetical protein
MVSSFFQSISAGGLALTLHRIWQDVPIVQDWVGEREGKLIPTRMRKIMAMMNKVYSPITSKKTTACTPPDLQL